MLLKPVRIWPSENLAASPSNQANTTGEVLALMGPSGSGKTTLLNVLARRANAGNAKVIGSILVNGQAVSQPAFRAMASFVEQEDALMGSLTARETVEIAAHLSRPRSVS